MQRREFITALGEAAAWPMVARAQHVMAADSMRRQVLAIAANTPAVLFAKAASGTIHIVFATSSYPAERLRLAHVLMPAANSVAFLANPNVPRALKSLSTDVQAAAVPLGLRLCVLPVNTDAPPETIGLS
jgi:hypothetical protein